MSGKVISPFSGHAWKDDKAGRNNFLPTKDDQSNNVKQRNWSHEKNYRRYLNHLNCYQDIITVDSFIST